MFRPIRRPLVRRFVTMVALLCLAFAQTAAAAYACARVASPERAQAVTILGLSDSPCPVHAERSGLPQTPASSSNLCKVHCQTLSVPDAGPSIGLPVAIVASHPIAPIAFAHSEADAQAPVPRRAAPPAALLTMRLLI